MNQIAQMREHVARLPKAGVEGRLSPLQQVLLTLDTELRVTQPQALTPQVIERMRAALGQAFDLLSTTLLR